MEASKHRSIAGLGCIATQCQGKASFSFSLCDPPPHGPHVHVGFASGKGYCPDFFLLEDQMVPAEKDKVK